MFASLAPVTDPSATAGAIEAVRHVHGAPAVVEYVLDLATATRTHPEITVGASPRATVGVLHAARAHAVVSGRTHLTPDDVQAVAAPSFAHRVAVGGVVDTGAARRVIADIVARTPVPRG